MTRRASGVRVLMVGLPRKGSMGVAGLCVENGMSFLVVPANPARSRYPGKQSSTKAS